MKLLKQKKNKMMKKKIIKNNEYRYAEKINLLTNENGKKSS